MAIDFLQRLADGEVLVTYAPLFTLLEQEKGRTLEGHLGKWIVDHPESFQDVVKAMYDAGCDIGYAGTQGNGRYRLRDFGLQDKVYEMTLRQTQFAKEVTPENCYLGGVIGLSGVFLPPVGDMTPDELYQSYVEQIIPMLEGGVDLFLVVDNDTEEVAIQIKAVKDNCDLPVVGRHFFYSTKRGMRTLMGVDVKTASARLQEAGADIIGAVCGDIDRPIGNTLTVVREMRQGCNKPLLVKPNAGLAQLTDGKIVQPLTPQDMAKEVPKWIAAGASLVGGCCGASLRHIKAITAAAKGKK